MNDNLPYIPTGEDLDAMVLAPYWLDASRDYPEPRYLLEYKGVGFSPLGGIQAISGQKKNGKTFFLAQLMAAILGTGTERVQAKLPGLKTHDDTVEWLGKEPTVLYVDTEMEELNTAKVLRRVHWLCGWDEKADNPRFRVLWLRQVKGDGDRKPYEERKALVIKAIEYMRPTAVFIDGIRDLVGDFNNNEEASLLVAELMTVATENNCCIWNVLHANPRPQNDDEGKMRGHLGTELGNKVSDTFVSVKTKTTDGVTFKVKQQDARGKDVEDWCFEITDDFGGLGIPRILDSVTEDLPKGQKADIDTDLLARLMKDAIQPPRSLTWRALRDALVDMTGFGSAKVQKWIKAAQDLGIIKYRTNRFSWEGDGPQQGEVAF